MNGLDDGKIVTESSGRNELIDMSSCGLKSSSCSKVATYGGVANVTAQQPPRSAVGYEIQFGQETCTNLQTLILGRESLESTRRKLVKSRRRSHRAWIVTAD